MLRAYFSALRKEWGALMTGALTIPLTVGALFMDATWQRVAFGLFALLCALFASYRIWAVEYRRANALAEAATRLPDVAALHEANTNLRNKLDALEGAQRHRRLTENQRSVIRQVMEGCFAEICEHIPEEEIKTYRPTEISIVALGSERETTTYRNDLVEAFSVKGFVGRPADWSAGMREHDVFNDLVTVLLPRDPRNIIHPKVLQALQDAGVNPREAPYPPMPQMHRSWAESSPAVTVIVGPR